MEKFDLDTLRHSTSHVMAHAVKQLYPNVKLGIGPSIENGFYYDFDTEQTFSPDDLKKIESKMEEIIKQDIPFKKRTMQKKEAISFFENKKEQYKVELIKKLEDKEISIYESGDFVDLCKGSHINSTGQIKAFKLLSVAGAYWKGNENNPMLQRIYGTAFDSKKELRKYLKYLEEAKKRDHRKIGTDLEYFSMPDEIGAGLILYHPKGAMLRSIIENFIKDEHLKRNYQLIKSPHILQSKIWKQSGHYDFYKKNMFIFKIEEQEYAIKPMNCPGHILVYKSRTRSYKELPLRFFELGTVYRNERSGVLHGLLRVRGFTQDDAHIFCLPSQITDEIINVIDFVIEIMNLFGFTEFETELSTRQEKSIGSDKQWAKATKSLISAMEKKDINYKKNIGDGAFYGPKIDIKLKDALNRTWQCATIQCDFALPERFNLNYIGEDGDKHRPIMIHRVILGSLERFMGTLLEHYAGNLPLWLSPEQIRIIPITDKNNKYVDKIKKILDNEGIRSNAILKNEKVGYKIRQAEINKVPYMLIIGDKEQKNNTISVRSKKNGNIGEMEIDDFIKKFQKEVKDKL